MADPTNICPLPWGASRRTAVSPSRVVRVITQTLGVPEFPTGPYVISGTATFAGVNGNGAICSLVTDPDNTLVKQTVAAYDGTYSFVNLPAGRYQVLVYDPNMDYRSKVAHVIVP